MTIHIVFNWNVWRFYTLITTETALLDIYNKNNKDAKEKAHAPNMIAFSKEITKAVDSINTYKEQLTEILNKTLMERPDINSLKIA